MLLDSKIVNWCKKGRVEKDGRPRPNLLTISYYLRPRCTGTTSEGGTSEIGTHATHTHTHTHTLTKKNDTVPHLVGMKGDKK